MLGALHAMHYVADGVAALDRYDPDWVKKVQELDTLDINDATNCVISAVFGNFYMGVNLLNGYDEMSPWVMTPEAVKWVRSHGFDAKDWDDGPLLNSLWKSKIAALQRRALTPLR
jgi:hypothetical protein